MCKNTLNTIALALGIAAIVLAFIGLPGGLDTEPILALAVICLAVANMNCCMPKKAKPAKKKR